MHADEPSDPGPVVVELFTSQGCSSCPTADALMKDLAKRDDILALSFHVDYWDYIGWKDSFAKPQFTLRQKAYAIANGWRMIYTPQMIVGGKSDVIGNEPLELADQVTRHKNDPSRVGIAVSKEGDGRFIVKLAPMKDALDRSLVFLVRYMPMKTVDIEHGENAGRKIEYANIVTSIDPVAKWDGSSLAEVPVEVAGTDEAAVILQEDGHGAVLAAARLR